MATFDLPIEELRRYRPERHEPPDFDAFWQATLAETRARPLDLTVEAVDIGLASNETFDVTFTGFGGARIKGWLVLRRNAVRDHLDLVALAARLGDRAAAVLATLDDYYADQLRADGRRVATQLAKQLAEPRPYDLDDVDLSRYRKLVPEWRSWPTVAAACRSLGAAMLAYVSGEQA